MNPDRLLQHFDQLAEAPDAVPRLRRFILDLAVRGKLVEQDPRDEPAVDLRKRIESEKRRLVAAGEIKRKSLLSGATADDLDFDLPPNWTVALLGEVAICQAANDMLEGRTVNHPWERLSLEVMILLLLKENSMTE